MSNEKGYYEWLPNDISPNCWRETVKAYVVSTPSKPVDSFKRLLEMNNTPCPYKFGCWDGGSIEVIKTRAIPPSTFIDDLCALDQQQISYLLSRVDYG